MSIDSLRSFVRSYCHILFPLLGLAYIIASRVWGLAPWLCWQRSGIYKLIPPPALYFVFVGVMVSVVPLMMGIFCLNSILYLLMEQRKWFKLLYLWWADVMRLLCMPFCYSDGDDMRVRCRKTRYLTFFFIIHIFFERASIRVPKTKGIDCTNAQQP